MSNANGQHDGADYGVDLMVSAEPAPRGKMRLKITAGGSLIHTDTINLHDAAARSKFAKGLLGKIESKHGIGVINLADIENLLMVESDKLETLPISPARGSASLDYHLVTDDDDPDRHGIFQITGDGAKQLANFTMIIDNDVMVEDEGEVGRQFEGSIRLDGRDSRFAIPAADYADGKKFLSTIFATAGPKARTFGDPAAIRDAVSTASRFETVRRTTASGWDAEATLYRTTDGLIDQDGYRPYRSGEVRFDPGPDVVRRQLGLKRLGPKELRAARRHLTEDYYRLHGREVMATLLGAAALAALERYADNPQRVAIWLKGLTGAGKSFPARLATNFFGDFDPRHPGHTVSWTSTGNYIQQTGYYFRDAIYLVDDYKPEIVQHSQMVRIIQTYSDGAGRGRLQADASPNVTRPIRGLLVSTGEDLPQNNASALARTIIVDVPNRPKDLERAERCMAMRPQYRGVMADFLRWTIAEGRLAGFAGQVRRHRRSFYEVISGQPNDARIAGNFAMLAAAFEEFALYLGDCWPDGEAEARAYIEEDLPSMCDRMLGLSRQQQASSIFLDTLRDLRAFHRVTFLDHRDNHFHESVIGRVADSKHYYLCVNLALAKVQESLEKQGRDRLKVTNATLIEQLFAEGVGSPNTTDNSKSDKPTRPIELGSGVKHRCILILRDAIEGSQPNRDEH